MKSKTFYFVSALMLCFTLLMTSCDKKQMAYDRLVDFNEQMEKESESYDELQWEEAAIEFEKICTDLDKYNSEYTKEEQKSIRKMRSKCKRTFAKSSIKNFIKDLGEVKDEIQSTLDELSDIMEE